MEVSRPAANNKVVSERKIAINKYLIIGYLVYT
jgi:hypothetical protein